MSDFTAYASPSQPRSFNLFSGFANFFAGLIAGHRVYRTYIELDQMTDAQIAEMGLTRADLPRKAAGQLFND